MAYQPYQPTWVNPYMPSGQGWQVNQLPNVQPVNGIVKVNGRESASQYQLPPNSMSPALFDRDGKTFYIVSTDGTGAKTVEAFDYVPHVEENPISVNGAEFVSRGEFDAFVTKVGAALEALNGVHGSVQAAARPDRREVERRPTDGGREPVGVDVEPDGK